MVPHNIGTWSQLVLIFSEIDKLRILMYEITYYIILIICRILYLYVRLLFISILFY